MGIHLDSKDGTNDYDYDRDYPRPRRRAVTISQPTPKQQVKEHTMISDTPDRLRRRAERMLARAELLESLPVEPDPDEDGCAVVWFKKRFGGSTEYTYAAVLADGLWYTSGPRGGGVGRRWSDLINWIYDGFSAAQIEAGGVVWQATAFEPL